MKKILILIILLPILKVNAEQRTNYIENTSISINDSITSKLNDNNYNTYIAINAKDTIKIESSTAFNYVYIIYYLSSNTGTITYNNSTTKVGENNFLHECIKLDNKTNIANIIYNDNVKIKEIFLFNDTLPQWVQTWNTPYEQADIILFSTHSDDEHLFFAGLIPTMINNNKKIQVVYLTNHNNTPQRLDEQLNGLWAVGLRNYPILGIIPDAYSQNLNQAINNLNYQDYSLEDVINFQIDIIRRFKPSIVVNHDEDGEYSHGQHILNTHALKEALNRLNEEEKPYKVYLHLYKENKIVMNYDIPLEHYNGLTAFEVSKLGYAEHVSQHYTWFTDWLLGKNKEFTLATQIKTYSPLEFGLYYSQVGYENVDNDMFYNIPEKTDNKPTDNNTTKEEIVLKEEIKEVPEDNNFYYYIIGGISIIIFSIILFIIMRKKH